MDYLQTLQSRACLRVSDGEMTPLLPNSFNQPQLVLVLPQLGDFDSLEYAWWLGREQDLSERLDFVAVGIGDRRSGQAFCDYIGFPPNKLYVDSTASIHQSLGLYAGVTWKIPGLAPGQRAFVNMMLMCAGLGSPGTLREVLRGYVGDKSAPQLFADEEVVKAGPLPPLKGRFFELAGGKNYQRPFELATLRLRNMTEVLRNWSTYVPDASYLTQRGGTFLFGQDGMLLYHHLDRNILGFAENMSHPFSFLDSIALDASSTA